jgi:Chlorophyllase enzyme
MNKLWFALACCFAIAPSSCSSEAVQADTHTAGTGGAAGATDDASVAPDGDGDGRGGSVGAAGVAGRGSADDAAVPSSPDALTSDAAPSGWPSVDDYGAHGPLSTQRDNNTGPNVTYDIFRPVMLGANARKHPIISWANGTLFGIDEYQKLLDHWASHGFVVIAAHSQSTAGGATHKAGIDWLVAENGRNGSIYFGRLDVQAVGAAGHSQGGGATIAAGSNKPGPTGIATTLPLMPILSFEQDKTIVSRQTVPMFNINATMDDRDPTGAVANQIYDGINTELVQASFIGIHEDAMSPPMYAPTLAWFRLHLMGDQRAKMLFYPDKACGLCVDPAWKLVRYKNTL